MAATAATDLNTKTEETKEATLKEMKEATLKEMKAAEATAEVAEVAEVATEESPAEEATSTKTEDLKLATEVAVVAAMEEVAVALATNHPNQWFPSLQTLRKPNPKKWSLSPTSSR